MTIARSLTVRGSGSSWAVYDNTGVRHSGWHSHQWTAEASLTSYERKLRSKIRPCLCCTTPFESEGAHNRLCNSCRRETEGLI
jgi:hypothetical protein